MEVMKDKQSTIPKLEFGNIQLLSFRALHVGMKGF
jgi:hypothetical protein